jgi:tetratricopeptide (TPR) repeat protein
MESLPRVAYGPSPPPHSAKGKSRTARGTTHGEQTRQRAVPLASSTASAGPVSAVGASASAPASASHRGRGEARRLVEEYWKSVWQSRHEPPLYHTYSDRYGGTRGVPYASRRANAAGRAAADSAADAAYVPACLARADEAFNEGRLSDAQAELERVLTLLQNSAESHGVLTIAALTHLRGATEADQQRSLWLGETLRRLGMMELIRGHYAEARELLNGSVAADPLYLDTYVLRASCCEALRCFADAYEDYAKYMKMTEASMEVLAHSGKCAAEAGLTEVAREQLGRLLRLSEELLRNASTNGGAPVERRNLDDAPLPQLSSTMPPLSSASWGAGSLTMTMNSTPLSSFELLRRACEFYVAHAHFYLGYVAERRCGSGGDSCAATAAPVTRVVVRQLRQEAALHYRAVLLNADYVQTYETSVAKAMQAGDFALARHLLCYLQRMDPHRADYFLYTAKACRAEGDFDGELRALSAALDRDQTTTERRTTLLARGAAYADEQHDWSRAIRDFTLLLGITPADATAGGSRDISDLDWSTPLALARRAFAYRQRHADTSRSSLLRREDEEAALVDYTAFLRALVVVCKDAGVSRQEYMTRANEVPFLCQPTQVVSALLVLASGAFRRHQYSSAVEYFSRAIALGWSPESPNSLLPPSERLAEQLYLSLAHHAMSLYPLGEEMFRVPYEAREAMNVPVLNTTLAPSEARRSTKTGGPGASRSSGGEGERNGFAHPPLLYVVVDQRYQQLRALEPTFFAAIEDAFLDLWEPYHNEVERLREEALSTRAGRRGKR